MRGFLFAIILCLHTLLAYASPIAEPKKGFGMGLLGGALAGAAVSNVLSHGGNKEHHHYHHGEAATPKTDTANAVAHSTIIDNGPVMANGCYQQTTTSPDPQDARKFEQTTRLICPTAVAATAVVGSSLPIAPGVQANNVQPITVNAIQPIIAAAAATEPIAVTAAVKDPTTVNAAATTSLTFVPLSEPPVQQQAGVATQPGQQQVYVLTKKSGYYEEPTTRRPEASTGSKLPVSCYVFVLLIAGIVML